MRCVVGFIFSVRRECGVATVKVFSTRTSAIRPARVPARELNCVSVPWFSREFDYSLCVSVLCSCLLFSFSKVIVYLKRKSDTDLGLNIPFLFD